MRKYAFILLSMIFLSQIALSQEIQDSRLKYDAYFNPYIETTIKNTAQKNITTVEFEIVYEDGSLSMWDNFRFDYEKKK